MTADVWPPAEPATLAGELESAISDAFLEAEAVNRAGREAAGKTSSGILTASQLGGCRREAGYSYLGVAREPVVSESRTAHLGTWQHEGFLPLLARAMGAAPGAVERPAAAEFAGVAVKGSVDLVTDEAVVDLKTVGEYGLAARARDGIPRKHRMQTTAYAVAFARGQRALVYLDRASGEHLVLTSPVTDEDVAEVEAWVREVVTTTREQGPDALPRDERGPGLSVVCDGCPFLRRCWGEDAEPEQVGPQRDLREDPAVLEEALTLLADASARASQAEKDRKWAGAILAELPSGTYGGWKHTWVRGSTGTAPDGAAAVAQLEALGIPVPMKATSRSGYAKAPRPVKPA